DLQVTDSYRSLDAQVTCQQEKGSMCADPGTSNHGLGIAVDLGGAVRWSGTAEHTWVLEHSDEYGWVKPGWSLDTGSKPEPWHFDFAGAPR
ncbi:MAG: M15 family metallopeptidase, partial [Cellulomonas sp.]|nr:M15 family metallopeptidase [Cellulomonas sp.]